MSAHQETLSVDTHVPVGDTVHIPLTHKKSPVVGGRSEVTKYVCWCGVPVATGEVLIATTCGHYLDTGLALCPCGKESLPGLANDDKFCRHSWSPGPALGIFAKSRWTGKRSRESTVKIKTSIAVTTPRRASSSRSWDASGDRASRVFHSCFICFIRFIGFIHVSFGRSVSSRRARGWGKIFAMEGGKRGKKGGKERGKSPGSNFARKALSNPRRNARAADAFYDVKRAGSSSSKSMSFFSHFFLFLVFFFLSFFFSTLFCFSAFDLFRLICPFSFFFLFSFSAIYFFFLRLFLVFFLVNICSFLFLRFFPCHFLISFLFFSLVFFFLVFIILYSFVFLFVSLYFVFSLHFFTLFSSLSFFFPFFSFFCFLFVFLRHYLCFIKFSRCIL